MLKFVSAQAMKRFRSLLSMLPIGLMSAEEQSYFLDWRINNWIHLTGLVSNRKSGKWEFAVQKLT